MTDVLRIRHVRAAGLCATGLYGWARANGLTMRELVRDGLDLDRYPHLRDDPFVKRTLEAARAEEARHG